MRTCEAERTARTTIASHPLNFRRMRPTQLDLSCVVVAVDDMLPSGKIRSAQRVSVVCSPDADFTDGHMDGWFADGGFVAATN